MTVLPPASQDPYVAWRGPLPAPIIRVDNTALLTIDMQYLDAHWDHGLGKKARQAGFGTDLQYYRGRLETIILRYSCIVVEDACGALLEEMHWASIRVMRNVYAHIKTTNWIVAAIGSA